MKRKNLKLNKLNDDPFMIESDKYNKHTRQLLTSNKYDIASENLLETNKNILLNENIKNKNNNSNKIKNLFALKSKTKENSNKLEKLSTAKNKKYKNKQINKNNYVYVEANNADNNTNYLETSIPVTTIIPGSSIVTDKLDVKQNVNLK